MLEREREKKLRMNKSLSGRSSSSIPVKAMMIYLKDFIKYCELKQLSWNNNLLNCLEALLSGNFPSS